ncbi:MULTISPECIES: HU family DNA-binding protein [Deinococcus]|uniref:Histone-like protein DNA-binding protein n=1 Tax=Deinococcus geothermalis (strain DSM 11300 / CIP 105573 / AG-3a) TaxID=319795 RepID=Q1J206_DEIGD|nr:MULTISPECIES: HU family DNA-binding protein [Deinococcus]ABF44478.1 histone-like protein DNA-binding protein [Deinococcus geothermalis DSM 11300]MBI0445683.1 DNA-binding protein [Deinococcus sp. DB0503]TDE86324.1 DNA-binding protein [Deinococcus sp. S9]
MARTSQSRAKDNATASRREEAREGSGKIAKTQIVDQIAERTSLSRKQASEAVATILDTIAQALREGKTVGLPGLGTLSVTETAARTGVRPGTSERIQIPAGKKIRFKVATTLKGNL